MSTAPTWERVVTSLLNGFQRDVLGKFPIVQHVAFGRYLTLAPMGGRVVDEAPRTEEEFAVPQVPDRRPL